MRQGRRTPQEAGDVLSAIVDMVAQGYTPEVAVSSLVDAGIISADEGKAALAAYVTNAGRTPVHVATPSPTMNPVRERLLAGAAATPTPTPTVQAVSPTGQLGLGGPVGGAGGVVPGGAAGGAISEQDAADIADMMKVPGMGRGYFMTLLLYHNATPEEAFMATQQWLNEQATLKKTPAKPTPEPKWGGTNMTLSQIEDLVRSSGEKTALVSIAKDWGLTEKQFRQYMAAEPHWVSASPGGEYYGGIATDQPNRYIAGTMVGHPGPIQRGTVAGPIQQELSAPRPLAFPGSTTGWETPAMSAHDTLTRAYVPAPKQYSDVMTLAVAQAKGVNLTPATEAGIRYGKPAVLGALTTGGGGGGGGGGPMTEYQKAQIALDWAQLAQQKALQEAQLAAQRRAVAMQIGEALAQQASANWQRGMPYMLPKEMQYAPGFEAGGGMQALANLGGYTYNPQQIGAAPSPNLESFVREALKRWG
jgi:hypothetical protein